MTAVEPPTGWPDAGVAWHLGDPLGEQRRLAVGRGAVDLTGRGVVAVTGSDRLTWLHSLTTQHLTGLHPGDSALALVLSPRGHVEHELHIVDDGETSWLLTEPDRVADLVAFLEGMRFRLAVAVADRTADYGVVWEPAIGPDDGPAWLVPQPFAGRGFAGRERVLPRSQVAAVVDAAGACGTWALSALRVAARMPRIGCETDHRTIPNEVGWLADDTGPNAVHLRKGCYRGQETVAKVRNLGRPPRRLVLLHLDGMSEQPPSHGDRVFLDGADVGWVGTGAQHYELGPIALAVVRHDVDDAAALTVGLADGTACAAAVG